MSTIQRAVNIKRNLGSKSARGYMVKRGWPWYARLYVELVS